MCRIMVAKQSVNRVDAEPVSWRETGTYLTISLPHDTPGIVKLAVSNQCPGGTLFAMYFADQLRSMFGTGFKNIIAMAINTVDRVIAEISPDDLASLSRAASFSIMIAARYGETWVVGSCGPGTLLAKRRDGTVEAIRIGGNDLLARRYEPLYLEPYEPGVDPSVDTRVEFETRTLPAGTYMDVNIQ